MNILAITLPEGLTWGNIATAVLTLLALITALIKLKTSGNQLGLKLTQITGILADFAKSIASVVTLVNTVETVTKQNETLMNELNKVLSEQREHNKNTATFISACFQESNLSDDKKLKLKVLLDELFYGNNMQVIDNLKEQNNEVNKQLIAANNKISEISEALSDTTKKLEKVQATTKKTRRIR
jgi:septal ring factor EnvC (AmiA/AmiB activator)